jgi:ornithine cyclodeaminase
LAISERDFEMLILTADEVRKALPMKEAIEAMKKAYASLSEGTAQVPLRTRLPIPGSEALSLFMPAYVHSQDGNALAIKIVSLFPTNPPRGLAYIQAAVLALNPDTGQAIAVLEGSSLTAIRTGAASGAAIDLLSRPESKTVAVFGAGVQGRTQLEAACTARQIKAAFIYDPDPAKAALFAEEMKDKGLVQDVRVAAHAKEAVQNADIICTATTSVKPVFEDAFVKHGTHISAVGSYTPVMQEVPAETLKRAKIFVDSLSASLEEAGDLIQPMRAGLFDQSHIYGELGEVVLGKVAGRQSGDEITYFKSVGIAVQDVMAAQVALNNALRLGIGKEVDF